ncbi:P-II family nitrogen regulator [Piscinibacter sakaiensis]|uniref:P-II family nitrogen regulator n=1 Tax=Piscinibacter sakaiensis TaxID=1547922 RepID=UPI003AAEFE65
MFPSTRKLLTIITEAVIEEPLLRDIEALGAHGYTVTDARGKGHRGRRDATWGPNANIRVEILCNDESAMAIFNGVRERYYENYSMILFVSDVEVLRPEKF